MDRTGILRDLKADWVRWSMPERMMAVLLLLLFSIAVPALMAATLPA